jgi:hypothetical protein
MLVFNDKPITANEIREALEHGDADTKAAAMRKAITMLLAGEQLPQVGGGGSGLSGCRHDSGGTQATQLTAAASLLACLLAAEPSPTLRPAVHSLNCHSQLFITIVRYVLPSEDHTVQKLLLLYLVRTRARARAFGRGFGWWRKGARQRGWAASCSRSCCYKRGCAL